MIEIALEGDELSFWRGLNEIDEIAEGETDPGPNDGPGFDAAVAVDAFLERGDFQDFVHGELAGLFYFAFDGDRPRGGVEVFGVFCRIALVGAEFVEIVVVGDIFEGVLLFRGTERALDEAGELRRGKCSW